MKKSLQAKLLVLGVFVMGVVSGGLVANLYDTRVRGEQGSVERNSSRDAMRQRFRSFEESLKLTPEQRQEMDRILAETRSEFRNLRESSRPQFEAIRKSSHERIRVMLNGEQRAKYDEFVEKRRKDHRDHSGRRPSGTDTPR